MKQILLTPYPGRLFLTRDLDEFRRFYKKRCGFAWAGTGDCFGTTVTLEQHGHAPDYLVYSRAAPSTLAHELGHTVLNVFKNVGIDPRDGSGEAFCYTLSHLMEEAKK